MGSPVITPEDVLESLMNDGTIDAIRLKIINQLKANEELKNSTIKMAEQSKVLNTPGAEKQTKRELFDALRQELDRVFIVYRNRMYTAGAKTESYTWLLDEQLYILGFHRPAYQGYRKENEKGKAKENENENENRKENSGSTSKKRSFAEMNSEGGADEVASKSRDPPSASEDFTKPPSPSSMT
ncbi:hypothetical protein CK203_078214 [Vitis vinifera]|uniref:Uncharacterized protein n=1 Tax=Vitis vinifera TaxID=29760 RepID=A0A438DUF3_VITVI|nr:hypothetical protein CK203_078214 [Vitis vinifera]